MVQYAVIATPTYDGRIFDVCAGAISEARLACIQAGIYPEWIIKSDSAYLSVVRNLLVRDFLAIPQATDLVFWDADVGVDPAALPRLLQHDAEVVGGAYPYKSDRGGFPVMLDEQDGMPRVDERTGLPLCHFLPTGFLRIRRSAFTRWRAAFPDQPEVVVYEDGAERERYFPFFETPLLGSQWFGEDVYWCKRWREELGGTLLLDPDISFTHVGRKHWHGNYHEYRRRLPGGDLAGDAPATPATPAAGPAEDVGTQLRAAVARAREGLGPIAQAAAELLTDNGKKSAPAPPFEPGEELLVGCGASRFKLLFPPGGSPAWHSLTTLDRNRDAQPDVVHDLEDPAGLPFGEERFAEIHAYEVLEHVGAQGDWGAFFRLFEEFWRVLRPGGYLIGSVPAWDSEAAWGDPSHTRVLPPQVFAYLSQEEYRQQIGVTMMADFRFRYRADFRIVALDMDEAEYTVDLATGRAKRIPVLGGRFTRFMLQAIKPSTYQDADMALVPQHQAVREGEYAREVQRWRRNNGREARGTEA